MKISTYSNEGRNADIRKHSDHIVVYMYENGHLKYCREIKNNLNYAEDLAENFVMRWGEFK